MRKYVVTASTFAAFLGYAIVRYVVFKGVPWSHVPVYVTNKSLALLGIGMLALAVARREERRWLGLSGLALILLHVVMSLAILSPAYFAKLYAEPTGAKGLSLSGEVAMMSGAVGLMLLLGQAWLTALNPERQGNGASNATVSMRKLGWGVLACGAAHCLALGWDGWWPPSSWPGMMPPITMLGVVVVLGAIAFRALRA